MRTEAEVWQLIEQAAHERGLVLEQVGTVLEGERPWAARCLYCGWSGPTRWKRAWARYDADAHRDATADALPRLLAS